MQLFVITFNFIANKEEIGLAKTLIFLFCVIKQDITHITGPRVSIFSPDLAHECVQYTQQIYGEVGYIYEDNLKNEDNLKSKDDLRKEDILKNEEDRNSEHGLNNIT